MSEHSPKPFNNTTKSNVQQSKMHNVSHLLKIISHTKKQENASHNDEKKNQSKDYTLQKERTVDLRT